MWNDQSQIFKRFWNDKILNSKSQPTAAETEAIIRLLDTKARGRQKADHSVAHTGIRQPIWERLFDDLKSKKHIQRTMDQIFKEAEEQSVPNVELLVYKVNFALETPEDL